jgi:hypothetical protein
MLLAVAAALAIAVSPARPAPDGLVHVHVSGLQAPAADVVIHGGIASGGKMFGLVPLRDLGGGNWATVLRAPGFLGVYPVRVRARGVYHETGAVVKVLPRAFAAEPGVGKPALVVEWWRRQAPAGASVASVTEWHAGLFFHRDQRYNRLLRVRFTLLGPWPRYHLRGGTYVRWFDVARTSLTADWRLLQVVAAP